jgi:hypothetical protein
VLLKADDDACRRTSFAKVCKLRARLQQEGFIRLDAAGFFAADRYITPDQIAHVVGDEVLLRVTRDALIRR